MDAVAQMQETGITAVFFPTLSAFIPLHEPNRDNITRGRRSFQYGATDRHQLDVYYPPNTGKKHPMLFYVYGGFVHGQRTRPAPADLIYGNLGTYFAAHGFVTLIPDYRLAPGTTYPGPAHDLRDALAWAVSNPHLLGPNADTASIFLLGHSSGGVHILTFLFEPAVLAGRPELRAHVKGAIIASALFHFNSEGMDTRLRDHVNAYYASPEAAAVQSPLALLRGASDAVITALPALALITCARDPEWLKFDLSDSYEALGRRIAESRKVGPKKIVAEGHNHISLPLALGTGQGEGWAEDVLAWMEGL
ncbi:Esterase lipase thioesterase family protein [Mycena venus]|uniref:Esterase lipase thioesterase family protein n=1 Tax=Mycena venus TaxID=2733690 RepID=A0A8H6X648_9AGAR|nr:Esterase lipase thioesterase family protein [Mycena venus]